MELKYSYKGFWIWLLCFTIVCGGVVFLPLDNIEILGRAINNVCSLAVTMLMFIMYKTEQVYWLNGTTYEEAVEAGSERRKEFGRKHFVRFGCFSVAYLGFSVLTYAFGMGWSLDMSVLCLGMIATAFSTRKFEL